VSNAVVSWNAPDGGPEPELDVWDVDALLDQRAVLVHLHGGFDHVSPHGLWAWSERLAGAGIRLACTLHDLDHPRYVDQTEHHERLRALVHQADDLFTLTSSANVEIVRRWGRPATVVPHPRMVTDAQRRGLCGEANRPTLVWLGACRANTHIDAVLDLVLRCEAPIEVVARLDGWDALTDGDRDRLVDAVGRSRTSELVITGRPTDDELLALFARRRAVVLPYAWGTHSTLVHLARELGVPVVVPDVGCHAEQGALVGRPDELPELVCRAAGATYR
jgi:glycosyltransferase involved in cell wall biosynthesis